MNLQQLLIELSRQGPFLAMFSPDFQVPPSGCKLDC
jgi:hypothetical protein